MVDLRTREGSREKFSGAAGIGLLSSRISLEGLLRLGSQSAKSTFFLSGRVSNMRFVIKPFLEEFSEYDKSDYSFYDINAKRTFTAHPSHRFYLSYYKGSDKGSSELNKDNSSETVNNVTSYYNNMMWGNQVASFRWNWLITQKLFSNLTLSYSTYDYKNENSKNGLLSTMNDSIKKTTSNYSLQSS